MNNYSFLEDAHKDELKMLRENLKKAKKSLSSTPLELRPELHEEIERLERALKRAESTVHKDKRDKLEHAALSKAAKEEKEKQKEGKGSWFMKDCTQDVFSFLNYMLTLVIA